MSTAATIGMTVGGQHSASASSGQEDGSDRVIRIGLIGSGGRGRSLLNTLFGLENLAFPAICDTNPEHLAMAQEMVVKAGYPKPEGYVRDEMVFEELNARDDLDAVLIATPWNWHTPMAVSAMNAGKYVGVEVPAALTLEECWQLVNAFEQTGVPCMMLENWSFRRDNLAVLKMIREGLLGEIVHCHCAHSHDCIDHWFFDKEGNDRWPADFLVRRNCDQYPTHSLGPVLSWMDINCGDRYDTLTSTASRSLGINDYFRRKFGPDHPNAKRKYAQGDIVTTVVKTKKGNTIVINYDMQLPRPYDNRWTIQGTEGIYNEQREAVYLAGRSPEYHQWEPFASYQEQYDHSWWKTSEDIEGRGHGGCDYLELREFLKAVRAKSQTPIDVYDSAVMSCIVALSEQSIAKGSAPVTCPDFTRGKWKTNKPRFALDI
ncbi:MAG: Gfo/Idh/MocA family oxidoreductase [bacterium]